MWANNFCTTRHIYKNDQTYRKSKYVVLTKHNNNNNKTTFYSALRTPQGALQKLKHKRASFTTSPGCLLSKGKSQF